MPRAGRRPVTIALLPWMVAGVQTQYEHLRRHLPPEGIETLTFEIRPFRQGGLIERLPLPQTIRGTLRSAYCTGPLFTNRRVHAVWSQTDLPMLPYLLSRAALSHIPVVCVEDSTGLQRASFGDHYPGITAPDTRKGRLTHRLHKEVYSRCARMLPWSRWAAASLTADYGVPESKISVIPPGVDTQQWRPQPGLRAERPRLLFVGGDFDRKGGRMLLEIWRSHLRERCDLTLVTRSQLDAEPGLEIHTDLVPNDPRLLGLYQRSDAMVLPTQADCFSLASIEAMACGLPVLVSAVGGIPEIVAEGDSGRLLRPGDREAWLRAVEDLLDNPDRRRRMGEAGRQIVEAKFDAAIQARRTFDAVLETIGDA